MGLREPAVRLLLFGLNVSDRVLHGGDLFGIFVGDIEVESFLERHHQLNDIQRIGTEVIDKAGGGIDLRLIHAQLFDDDLLYLCSTDMQPSPKLLSNSLILPGEAGVPQL